MPAFQLAALITFAIGGMVGLSTFIGRPERALRAAAAAAGLGRRCRRIVRLSRALFSGAALCSARRGRAFELPVAAVDRSVLVLPARRAAGGASCHRRAGRTCRHGVAADRRPVGLCTGAASRTFCSVCRGVCLGELFSDVAAAEGRADRCGRGVLSRHCVARRAHACAAREYRMARDISAVARDRRARPGTGGRGVLHLGYRHEARRYPGIGSRVLRDAAALDRVSDPRGICQGQRQYRHRRGADCRRRIDRGQRTCFASASAFSSEVGTGSREENASNKD